MKMKLVQKVRDVLGREPRRSQVSSENPWLLVLLVDGSHSMSADWGSSKRSMAEIVEQSINHLLYDMALNYCVTEGPSDSGIKDRIHLKILVYNEDNMVRDPLPSDEGGEYSTASGDSGWVKSYHDQHQYPQSNGASPVVVPRWLMLTPEGTTPMLSAFKKAREVVESHISEYPDSCPPVILNVSDGEPTDCGHPIDWDLLSEEFEGIVSLGKGSNKPLVCNVHLGPLACQPPILFPSSSPSLDGLESGLWRISSIVPEHIQQMVESEYGLCHERKRRFFVFNSDLIHFHKFLQFSTMMEPTHGMDGSPGFAPSEVPVMDAEFTEIEEE